MKHPSLLFVLAVLGGASPAISQRGNPSNSLARAQAAFGSADVNQDGKLAFDEAKAMVVAADTFRARDEDKDGAWSKDEYLLYYREQLTAGGQPAGADLEAEVARIQALRRAKEIEASRRSAQEKEKEAANPGTTVPDSRTPAARPIEDPIDARIKTALDEFERRAAAGQPSREELQRVRNLLVARARAEASSGDAGLQSKTYLKMVEALDRVDRRAAEGQYSKEEVQALRYLIVHRARAIEAGQGPPAQPLTQPGAAPAMDLAAIQVRIQTALDELEKRAAGGTATREDFQRIRDLITLRARAAAAAGDAEGASVDTYTRMTQALDRLERMAGEGKFSKEDYQQFRDLIVHRARAIEGAKAPAESQSVPATSDLASIQVGLLAALDALEKRAAAGGATREDFQRVRDQLAARARAAANGGAANAGSAPSFETSIRLLQSLERLEKAAAEGKYSREDYAQLRETMIQRARVIDTSTKTTPNAPSDAQTNPPAPARDPGAVPARPKPAETPGNEEKAKRPAPPPPPPPQRPAENKPEKEKPPPPQRPPPERPGSERA